MDVNEKIVETWMRDCRSMLTTVEQFYGQFYSDIDILAVSLLTREIWDCEIKVRTGSSKISDKTTTNKITGKKKIGLFKKITDNFNSPLRASRIKSVKGTSDFTMLKVFITTKSFLGEGKNRKKWIKRFEDKGVTVIFLDDIMAELSAHAKKLKKSNNEVVQVLRLIHRAA